MQVKNLVSLKSNK